MEWIITNEMTNHDITSDDELYLQKKKKAI